MSKVIYIADASNWFYKFSSAYSLSRNIGGVDIGVSALYGMVRAVKASPFSTIILAVDGTPEMSNLLLPSYKGQRSREGVDNCNVPASEVLKTVSALSKELSKNIYLACSPGQEADQVISSIAHVISGSAPEGWKFASELNHMNHPMSSDFRVAPLEKDSVVSELSGEYDTCVISTTDSDMYQLQRLKNVYIDTSTNGSQVQYSNIAPKAVHNMNCSEIVGYKMLFGDTSDNVPQIKISIKKDVLINLVKRYLNSFDKCKKFVNAVKTNSLSNLSVELSRLASEIIDTGQQAKLSKNFKVVALIFYSWPYLLSYPKFDARGVLKKYKIKL